MKLEKCLNQNDHFYMLSKVVLHKRLDFCLVVWFTNGGYIQEQAYLIQTSQSQYNRRSLLKYLDYLLLGFSIFVLRRFNSSNSSNVSLRCCSNRPTRTDVSPEGYIDHLLYCLSDNKCFNCHNRTTKYATNSDFYFNYLVMYL